MDKVNAMCMEHNEPYSLYCHTCELVFCNDCPPHEHTITSLLLALCPEGLNQYIKEINNIQDTIDITLLVIRQIVDSLLTSSGKDSIKPLENEKTDFTSLRKTMENNADKIKALAVTTSEYDKIKIELESWIKKLQSSRASVESKFHEDNHEAYRVIISLKGLKKSIDDVNKGIESLEQKTQEISSVRVKNEIWQRKTFKKLSDYIENLRTTIPALGMETLMKIKGYFSSIAKLCDIIEKLKSKNKKDAKAIEEKKVRSKKRLLEISEQLEKLRSEKEELLSVVESPEQCKELADERAKQLDEAEDNLAILKTIYCKYKEDISLIPDQLLTSREELNKIMKKRRMDLYTINDCVGRIKMHKDKIEKTLKEKKEELEKDKNRLLIYKKLNAISLVSTDEKKLLLEESNKRLSSLDKEQIVLADILRYEKNKMEKAKKCIRQLREEKDLFQSTIDDMDLGKVVITLNDIEKSKNDIEKSNELNRTELVKIINYLIKVQTSVEEDIVKKQEEADTLAEIDLDKQNEVYSLMDSCKSDLELLKNFLSKLFLKGPDTLKTMCIDGRPGKVNLECGHYLCSKCFFTYRELVCKGENEEIPCISCGGIKRKIGNYSS